MIKSDHTEQNVEVESDLTWELSKNPEHFTDRKLSELLTSEFRAKFLHAVVKIKGKDHSTWYECDQRGVWKKAPTGTFLKALSDRLSHEYSFMQQHGDQKARAKALELLSTSKLKNVAAQLTAALTIDGEEFDQYPHVIAVENGVFNFETGKLEPPQPDLLLTQCMKGSYRPEADAGFVDQLLLPFRHTDRDYMRRVMGMSVLGQHSQRMTVLRGDMRNGKSVFVDALVHTVGGAAANLKSSALSKSKGEDSENWELMRFQGLRCGAINEFPATWVDENSVKRVVRTPMIEQRAIQGETIEYLNLSTLIVTQNHMPLLENTAPLRDRVAVVFMPYTFVNPELANPKDFKLAGIREFQYVTRYLDGNSDARDEFVTFLCDQGVIALREGDFEKKDLPLTIVQETNAAFENADTIGTFITEELVPSKNSFITYDDLYEAYSRFAKRQGHERTRLAARTWLPKFLEHDKLEEKGGVPSISYSRHSNLTQSRLSESRYPDLDYQGSILSSEEAPGRCKYVSGVRFRSRSSADVDHLVPQVPEDPYVEIREKNTLSHDAPARGVEALTTADDVDDLDELGF